MDKAAGPCTILHKRRNVTLQNVSQSRTCAVATIVKSTLSIKPIVATRACAVATKRKWVFFLPLGSQRHAHYFKGDETWHEHCLRNSTLNGGVHTLVIDSVTS